MSANERTTAPVSSVGADEGQPLALNTNDIIHDEEENYNDNGNFKKFMRKKIIPIFLTQFLCQICLIQLTHRKSR